MKAFFNALLRFFGTALNRRLMYLLLIILIALLEFLFAGQARRTFVFRTALDGKTVVEDRMLPRSASPEEDIRRYVEDALLGPVSPDSLPLFPRETRLVSLMLRNGAVYAAFSEDAALPVEGGDVFEGFLTLNQGIRRNFAPVKEVKFFIEGNEIFFDEFTRFFDKPADNFVNPFERH